MLKRLRTSLTSWVPGYVETPEYVEDEDVSETDRYRAFGNKSIGVWDGALGLVTQVRQRGKQLRMMGVCVGGTMSLFAEEALYLSERSALVTLADAEDSSALSTEALYGLCLRSDEVAAPRPGHALCPLYCYWAYAHLRSLGYAVFRPRGQDELFALEDFQYVPDLRGGSQA